MTKESSFPESDLSGRPRVTALIGAVVPVAAGLVVLTGVPWAGAAGTPVHPRQVTQLVSGECVTTVQVTAHNPKYPSCAGD